MRSTLCALPSTCASIPSFFEELCLHIPATGAVGIGDGGGLKQSLFERAIGRDIRYRRAGFHHHADGRIRQFNAQSLL